MALPHGAVINSWIEKQFRMPYMSDSQWVAFVVEMNDKERLFEKMSHLIEICLLSGISISEQQQMFMQIKCEL